MTNAKGSKSARTAKVPKTPAQGAAPKVTLDNGTVVVLPNPGETPPPPKGRPTKAEPTEATKPEVPVWAKRAAARNTQAEMAGVQETVPGPVPGVPETAPEELNSKKGSPRRPSKAKGPGDAIRAAAPGSLRAVGNGWLDAMRAKGSSASTLSSYGNDLEVAHEFFGDVKAADLTADKIAKFNASKGVMKKTSGKPKAKPTIMKTRRALRLALTWAEAKGLIKKAPYSAA